MIRKFQGTYMVPFFLFVPFHLYAKDCYKENFNLDIGLKFTYKINHLIDVYGKCHDEGMWKEEGVLLKQTFERNKKTEKLDCSKFESRIKGLKDCYQPEGYLRELAKKKYFDRSFNEICAELYPQISKREKDCKKRALKGPLEKSYL